MSTDKTANWTTFVCEWQFFPHCVEASLIMGGNMTLEDDAKDRGEDAVMLGRWSDPATATGVMVCKAKDATALHSWMVNWAHLANCKVYPILDDNEVRRIAPVKPSDYQLPPCDQVGDEPQEGESLYWVRYKYRDGQAQEQGMSFFAQTTAEIVAADQAGVRLLGRWHNPANGTGFAIEAVKNASVLYKHCYNWQKFCETTVVPVLTDTTFRKMMKAKPGFQGKVDAIMKK